MFQVPSSEFRATDHRRKGLCPNGSCLAICHQSGTVRDTRDFTSGSTIQTMPLPQNLWVRGSRGAPPRPLCMVCWREAAGFGLRIAGTVGVQAGRRAGLRLH